MSQWTGKVYWSINKIIVAISAIIILFLLYYSVFYSQMFPRDYIEWEHVVRDDVLSHLLFIVVWLAGTVITGSILNTIKKYKIACVFLLLIYSALCFWYVFDGTTFLPTGDQYYLCENAALFLDGNFSGLMDGGYLAKYPYQLGLTLYMELVTALAGPNTYMVLSVMNMLALFGMSIVGMRLCECFSDRTFSVYYIIVLLGMIPLYFYISFLYGECFSLLFSMIFVWQLTEYIKKTKKIYLCLMCMAGAVAVICRANSMIVLIAGSVILMLCFLKEKKKKFLMALILIWIFMVAARSLVIYCYEMRSGHQIGEGIPPLAWIAMGMQESIRGNGWYSEYGVEIYEQNAYDTDRTGEVAKEYISSRLTEFLHDPAMAWQFYKEKILSQWNEPSYEALLVLNAGVDHNDISGIKQEILYGKYYEGILRFMNMMQVFMYAMSFVSAVYLLVKRGESIGYLLHLIFVGGFLFQILWEAKSRYVLFYIVMMLPLCAFGMQIVCAFFRRTGKRIEAKLKEE